MPSDTTWIPGLAAIPDLIAADPGLRSRISAADIAGGIAGAEAMNAVIAAAIDATGANRDGRIDGDDARDISDWIRARDSRYDAFVDGHGDDAGRIETGFHLVQGDGASIRFQGKTFVDVIADGIYHIGFRYVGNRFVNEDGDANATVDDVAGWLNWFVNGQNRVYGTDAADTLYSAVYSDAVSAAASEAFSGRGGNDEIWAGAGDDTVWGGDGNDTSSGDDGNDLMKGGRGNDSFYGGNGSDTVEGNDGNDVMAGGSGDDVVDGGAGNDTVVGQDGDDLVSGGDGDDQLEGNYGNDTMSGGTGSDTLWGHDGADVMDGGDGNDTLGGGGGNDTMMGGSGRDKLWGDAGDDLIDGGFWSDELGGGTGDDTILGDRGHDRIFGQDGDDVLDGGAHDDTIMGQEGRDIYIGGTGRDHLLAWEDRQVADTFVFRPGDSGTTSGTRDVIEGFKSGTDTIDLTAFGDLDWQSGGRFSGRGNAEVRFDGDYILIDADGNGRVDEAIELKWVNNVAEGDFVL